MQAKKTRLLFVDDEPSIRITVPLILEKNGFQVTAVESVKDALQQITANKFDVLLTDLNIGQPGDGFTVVSAMRRTQPEVATVILTGYPAFETALAAIRNQVDEYLVKPAHPEDLVKTLRQKLDSRGKDRYIPTLRLPELIHKHRDQIIDLWLSTVEQDVELSAIKMKRTDRVDHLPMLLDEIVRVAADDSPQLTVEMLGAAEVHGRQRHQQGYSIAMVLRENRLVRRTIFEFTQANLIGVEISYVLPDLTAVEETLGQSLEAALAAFMED